MISLLIASSLASTSRATPSHWLNNWDSEKPLLALWSGSHYSWTIPPQVLPGIQSVRGVMDMTRDIMQNDSFAFSVDGNIYGDPKLLNSTHLGGCVFEADGEMWTEYTHYGMQLLPVAIKRSFYMPPHKQFYLIKYHITSQDGKDHKVNLLDFLVSGPCNEWGRGHCDDGLCTIDQQYCYGTSIAASVDVSHSSTASVGNGDFNNGDNALHQFAENGKFSTVFKDYDQLRVSFGAVYDNLDVTSHQPATVTSYRGFGSSVTDVVGVLTDAMKNKPDDWISNTKQQYSDWLASGVQPSLTGDALDLYKKSLVVLKNSQNPQKGTIASSLHSLYGYKTWMRDSIMAAFMLDAAGYHDEAKKYYDWVPTAPLTDIGGYHTCYNTFTGDTEGFVEPQYDSVGLYLMAMNYHLQCFGDEDWVRSHLSYIESRAQWIVEKQGQFKLSMSDRAPWEESTDHHTGEDIPEQYYTWTQGLQYGGLLAAAKIEEKFGKMRNQIDFLARASELKTAVMENLYDYTNHRFYRGRHADDFSPDTRAEAATLSVIFTGLISGADAISHYSFITKRLTHLGYGISRYEDDPYFFDSIWNPCGRGTYETQQSEPVWPVVTAYAAWCEDIFGYNYQKRLDWMVEYSAWGNMPTGEAVDSADGALVVPSSPDGFEHGGVYVFTVLLNQKKAKSLLSTLN